MAHVMPSALQAGLQPGALSDTRSISSSTSSPTSKDKEKGKDSAVVLQLAKTKMCAFFERGKCSSDTCRYAHSPAELRRPPNLQKTKLCKAFLQGKCRDGENCSFAHGDADLRVTAGIYKTQMCNFYERGHCKKGDRCNHAHGDADLRPVIPSPQKTPVREKGFMGALQTPDARTPPKVGPQGDERSPPSKKERLPLAELLNSQDSQEIGPSVADLAALAFAPPVPLSWTSYQLSPSTYGEPTPLRMLDPVDMLVDTERREMMGLGSVGPVQMPWSMPPLPQPVEKVWSAPPGLEPEEMNLDESQTVRNLFSQMEGSAEAEGEGAQDVFEFRGGASLNKDPEPLPRNDDTLSQSLANLDNVLQGFASDVAHLVSLRKC